MFVVKYKAIFCILLSLIYLTLVNTFGSNMKGQEEGESEGNKEWKKNKLKGTWDEHIYTKKLNCNSNIIYYILPEYNL